MGVKYVKLVKYEKSLRGMKDQFSTFYGIESDYEKRNFALGFSLIFQLSSMCCSNLLLKKLHFLSVFICKSNPRSTTVCHSVCPSVNQLFHVWNQRNLCYYTLDSLTSTLSSKFVTFLLSVEWHQNKKSTWKSEKNFFKIFQVMFFVQSGNFHRKENFETFNHLYIVICIMHFLQSLFMM